MPSLDEIISASRDVREVKRALSIKMLQNGLSAVAVSTLLNVSVQWVSKWKVKYEAEGSAGYLTDQERNAVVLWIKGQKTLSVEQVRDYIEAEYDVVYQSKQSYYDLLAAGGMSYHRSEKYNPKRDKEQVQQRRQEIKKSWQPMTKPSNAAR